MIARWWRHTRGWRDEWQLIALRSNGVWAPLAIVSRQQDKHHGWFQSACITSGGKGGVWMGSVVRTKHQHRGAAFRAAEAMCGFPKAVKHATWLPDWWRGWDFAPRAKRGRIRQRAEPNDQAITAFLDNFAKIVMSVARAHRTALLDETKTMMVRVFLDLAHGHLGLADDRLENAIHDEIEPDSIAALARARAVLAKYKKAREAIHG